MIAASIAAGAALLTLAGNVLGSRRAEMRTAHRTALTGQLQDLAEGIHETVAAATILRRRNLAGSDVADWIEKGKKGSDKLKSVRPQCRYTLFGLDDPLRTLSRMPEWVATYKNVPGTNADKLLAEMTKLASEVDAAIRWSYRRGLPPGAIRRWRLKRRSDRVRDLWYTRFKDAPPRDGTPM